MTRTVATGLALSLLLAGAAHAEPVAYNWTGMGTNTLGSSKCQTYKMSVDVTVDGNSVKGLFQQQGRDQRHFEATKDAKGIAKTKATIGGGSQMDVTVTLTEKESRVLLDGYCKFEGKLTKK